MREKFDIVVATDLNRGIGKNGTLPWRISQDLKYFKDLTSSTPLDDHVNAVIMGRKTWESIPPNFRPLKGRVNLVLTRGADYEVPEGVLKAQSVDQALAMLALGAIDRVFIIGGAEIYRAAMMHERCGFLYLTEVKSTFDCDTFLDEYKPFFKLMSCSEVMQENNLDFVFKVYEFNFPEYITMLDLSAEAENA